MQPAPYYVTTPIYYVNGTPHIGHIFTTVLAETAVNYQRLKGAEGYMLTGCDEHGLKVQTTAEQNGVKPQQWCDKVANEFRTCFDAFDIKDYNRFIRTTDDDHVRAAQHLWTVLQKNGHIYKAKYEGWYNVSDECFVTDTNLVDGVDKQGQPCKVTIDGGVPCIWQSEENYMFRLTAFKDMLLKFYAENPDVIVPSFRQQEIVQFIETGLQDLSISRSKAKIYWGIEVPGDADHTMYVWIDALTNYLTGAGYPNLDSRWPCAFHVLGKDIARFHCVYWPAFLMGAGLPLPKRWFVHGWWVAGDARKIGKSLGNASSPQEMAKKFGVDALKYYLLSEGAPEIDCQISDTLVAGKLNGDLANSLGNLLNRCVMDKVNPDQIVPVGEFISQLIMGAPTNKNAIPCSDLVQKINELSGLVDKAMSEIRTKDALLAIFAVVYQINGLIQSTAPWQLLKTDKPEHAVVMYTAIESLRIVGLLLLPFLKERASCMLRQLGIPKSDWKITKETMTFGWLKPGTPLGKEREILFAKVEIEAPKPEPKEEKPKKEKKEKKPKVEAEQAGEEKNDKQE